MEGLVELLQKMNTKNPYEIFSIDEASVAFNISKKQLTKALNNKEIQEFHINKKDRNMRRKDIEKWIDSKAVIDIPLIKSSKYI